MWSDWVLPSPTSIIIIWGIVVVWILFGWYQILKEGEVNVTRPNCVITGCALFDNSTGQQVWGDLHEVGPTWIFNAVLFGSEAAWHSEPLPDVTRTLTVFGPFFERRGVIVVAKTEAVLNDAAKRYLGGTHA